MPFVTPYNITTIIFYRRFRAQFYVSFIPSSLSTGFSSGEKSERLPTHDGGQEVISARFLHPSVALQEFKDGKIRFMPPQYYILATLCDILHGDENTAAQQEKVAELSRSAFGSLEINPVPIADPEGLGRLILTYEGDETRGGPKGRLHRALVVPGKGGVRISTLYVNVRCSLYPRCLKRSRFSGTLTYYPISIYRRQQPLSCDKRCLLLVYSIQNHAMRL